MKPICIPILNPEQLAALENLYRSTCDVRLRARAQMILLAAERHLTATEIAEIVRVSEDMVRRRLKRYLAEGIEGLRDVPHPGAPRKVTADYQERLVYAARPRPRSLGLPFSQWALRRLADYMAEQTGIRVGYETVRLHLKAAGIVLSRPRVRTQKKTIEETCDGLGAGDHFYYADEFNVSWMPTLKAMWSPKGRQVMTRHPPSAQRHRRSELPLRRNGCPDP